MAWKWYEITGYYAAVGSNNVNDPTRNYYGSVQLFGEGLYALLKFHKDGPLPLSDDPLFAGVEQRFYGHLDYQQMEMMVDLLRNESPVKFGWYEGDPNVFHLMAGKEPVGEGDGSVTNHEGCIKPNIKSKKD